MSSTPATRLPQQAIDFIEELVNTGDYLKAARAANVHPRAARGYYRELLETPDSRAVYDRIIRTRFADAAPLALQLLVDMVKNTNNQFDQRVRLDAAKTLLDRSGYSAKDIAGRKGEEKDMREMSRDELLQIVNQGEKELANRATLVNNVAINDTGTAQPVDIFD